MRAGQDWVRTTPVPRLSGEDLGARGHALLAVFMEEASRDAVLYATHAGGVECSAEHVLMALKRIAYNGVSAAGVQRAETYVPILESANVMEDDDDEENDDEEQEGGEGDGNENEEEEEEAGEECGEEGDGNGNGNEGEGDANEDELLPLPDCSDIT